MSFAVALLHCEQRFGGAWVYAPGRWRDGMGDAGTLDGCVPVRVVWAYFAAIQMGRAVDVIDTARGIGLAFGGKEESDATRVRTETFNEAFPPEHVDG